MPASDLANRRCSVGPYLRESRESRGISLEEAARVTRIGKNYLAALEGEMFDTLPNTAYVKGFLRAYAAFLGLSGDETVAMYERALSPVPLHTPEQNGGPGEAGTGKPAAYRRSRWVVPLVLLVLVLAAAYIFDDKGTTSAKAPLSTDAPPPAPAPVQPPRSSAQGPTAAPEPSADKGKVDLRPANADPKGGGIVLKLKVNQDSWLSITIDGMVSQQYDLKAGDLIEWKGDRVFALDLGNGGGIEAEFNGKPLQPFGEPGKPAHVVLKADGTPP